MQQKTFFIIKQLNAETAEVIALNSLNAELVTETETIYFTFSDPSTSENHPGWPLRNYIALILHHW